MPEQAHETEPTASGAPPEQVSTSATTVTVVDIIPRRKPFQAFLIMLGLCSAVFLAALNRTVVSTAVPTITHSLDSATGYAWISTSYVLANASSTPIWSKFSDIWGRKPILLSAVTLYFCSSILCALAPSMTALIAGRTVQGVAGGGLLQIAYTVIGDIFSVRERGLYLGVLQLMWALAGGLGPLVGGALSEYVGWRWVFWINLPLAAGTWVVLWVWLDVWNPRTRFWDGVRVVDWAGIVTLVGGVVMVLVGLNLGGDVVSWKSVVVTCLVVLGVGVLGVFVWVERRAEHPLVPLDLFGNASNVAALVVGVSHDWATISMEYYLPLWFQAVQAASPTESGYRIIPLTLAQSAVAAVTGVLMQKTGRYLDFIWLGKIFFTLGCGLFISLGTATTVGTAIGFQIITAFGSGMLFQPPLIALQAAVAPRRTASAISTMTLFRTLSTSIAIVAGQAIFSNAMSSKREILVGHGVPDAVADLFSGSTAAANVAQVNEIMTEKVAGAIREAFDRSLQGVWITATCIAACGAVASGFISKQKLSREHTEHRTGL